MVEKEEAMKKAVDNNYKKILVLQNKSLKEEARDTYKEDEQKFLDCLKKAVQNSNTPLMHVYKFNATLYVYHRIFLLVCCIIFLRFCRFPGVAKKQPYLTLVKAMKKWRYAAITNQK